MNRITELLVKDKQRMEALKALRDLGLHQGFIAAGFLRNLIWDHVHKNPSPTPLNDVDVVYFCTKSSSIEADVALEEKLTRILPSTTWQVRNQALMHHRNRDRPYKNIVHAMAHWPEKETAVAVRLLANDRFEYATPFSMGTLFDLSITYNPARSRAVFNKRVSEKRWLEQWPMLNISPYQSSHPGQIGSI